MKKTVLITGAAVGIGRAAALRFANEGYALVLLDIQKEKLDALAAELSFAGDAVMTAVCDVSDAEAVQCVVKEAEARFGGIDILVNNAALWRCWKPFTETTAEEWKTFLDINIMGTVYPTQAVLPGMLARGWGRIINIASVAGV